MNLRIKTNGSGVKGQLVEDNYSKEYIFVDLEVISITEAYKEYYNVMHISLLSLHALKEKWKKSPQAKNSICVSGNVFTIDPFSGSSLIIKDIDQVSLEQINFFLKTAIEKSFSTNMYDIKLFLFPLIKYVHMNNVDENHMIFYEQSMDGINSNYLLFDWSIKEIKKSTSNSDSFILVNNFKSVKEILPNEIVDVIIQLSVSDKESYNIKVSLVGIDYFFNFCDQHFQTSTSIFLNSTPLHVVSEFSHNKAIEFIEYIFNKVSAVTSKELLFKLSAFAEITSIDINTLFSERKENMNQHSIDFIN